jgi:hypothetical protein
MPSYFFNARGPDRYVTASEGVELDSVDDAHALALQSVLDIASDPVGFRGARSWAVEVMDAEGQIVTIIPFSLAVQGPIRGRA